MLTFQRDGAALALQRIWFSEAIEDDPWVAFHATSSVNESSIDQRGLSVRSNRWTAAALNAARIMANAQWDGPGYLELAGFGAADLAKAKRPVYLALYPQRPVRYLTRNLSGGEFASGLAEAIPALLTFIDNESAFDMHFQRLRDSCIACAAAGRLPPRRVLRPNREWFRNQATPLRNALVPLMAARAGHTHGVLYAVRLEHRDVVDGTYSGGEGLGVHHDILASQLVGKLVISGEDALASTVISESATYFLRHRDRGRRSAIAEIVTRAAAQRTTIPHAEGARDLLTEDAGEDETPQLLLLHGTVAVRNYAQEQLSLPPHERRFTALSAIQSGSTY